MSTLTAHSRGPWKLADHDNCGSGGNVYDASGRRIAHTAEYRAPGQQWILRPEALSNARLAAAAPMLLEVVQVTYRAFRWEMQQAGLETHPVHWPTERNPDTGCCEFCGIRRAIITATGDAEEEWP